MKLLDLMKKGLRFVLMSMGVSSPTKKPGGTGSRSAR